jgi:hypothetical protein
MWHRVDYDDDDDDDDENYEEEKLAASSNNKISIGASIFHFFPLLYITNYPLFSILIVPNLLKEMIGYNVQ